MKHGADETFSFFVREIVAISLRKRERPGKWLGGMASKFSGATALLCGPLMLRGFFVAAE
jgi:hypothetical protein